MFNCRNPLGPICRNGWMLRLVPVRKFSLNARELKNLVARSTLGRFQSDNWQKSCRKVHSGKLTLLPWSNLSSDFCPLFSWQSTRNWNRILTCLNSCSLICIEFYLQSIYEVWKSLLKNTWLRLRFENANLGWMQLLTLSSWPNWVSIFRLFQQGYQKHWHQKIWGSL